MNETKHTDPPEIAESHKPKRVRPSRAKVRTDDNQAAGEIPANSTEEPQAEAYHPSHGPRSTGPDFPEPTKKPEVGGESHGRTIPSCPAEDPMAGDKTPAVIAWWFKHHPKEAAVKYNGRQIEFPTDHE